MIYRSGQRIQPHQVRAKTFRRCRRGLDPDEVYAYLAQVADELDRMIREESIILTEAERIRQGLRQWQSRHAHCTVTTSGTPDRGRWSGNRDRW